MAENETSPQEVLRSEILAEARRQAEGILLRAGEDVAAVSSKALEDAQRERAQILEKARTDADRRTAVVLAAVSVESGRMESARIEELLESVRADAGRRIQEIGGEAYRAALVRLAAEAIRAMEGEAFVVDVREADRALCDAAWIDEVRRAVGRAVGVRVETGGGERVLGSGFRVPGSGEKGEGSDEKGLVVRDEAGRQVWDNRLSVKMGRLWPALRREIAAEVGLHER